VINRESALKILVVLIEDLIVEKVLKRDEVSMMVSGVGSSA